MVNNLPNNFARIGVNTSAQSGAETSSSTGTSDVLSIFTELLNLLGDSEGTQDTQQKPEGLPQDQDPDSYAQQYADENGISLDEAKAELEEKYGAPQNPDQSFTAQA